MSCRSVTRFLIEEKALKRRVFLAFSGEQRIAMISTAVPTMQGTRSLPAAVMA